MNIQLIIFGIVGIILFLYGVLTLSKKLEELVKEKITIYLRKITNNPIKGTIFGFVVTALNQSSTATSVLTVTLVGAGLLSFYSSLGILFGANIGTTITVSLVALGIIKIAPFFILIGFILMYIKKTKRIGEIFFYFGLIFFGLFLVSFATTNLKEHYLVLHYLKTPNILLALFYSTIFTIIVGSSAITISTAIILSQQQLISLPTLMGIILGANIGTTVTALLAAIGGPVTSKRTAIAHLLFNVGGSLIFLPFLLSLSNLFNTFNIPLAQKGALFHIFFNVTTAIIFLILIKPFSWIIIKMIPGKEKELSLVPIYLNKTYIDKPEIALQLVKKELRREYVLSYKNMKIIFPLINKFNEKRFNEARYLEEAVNNLQGDIASFLNDLLIKNNIKTTQAKIITKYAIIVDCIERISDRAINIGQIAHYKQEDKESFSEEISTELDKICKKIIELNKSCIKSFTENKYDYKLEIEIRERLKKLEEEFNNKVEIGIEKPQAMMLFSDILINLKRIIDNCNNIATNLQSIKDKEL